jgi:peroxiredoxin
MNDQFRFMRRLGDVALAAALICGFISSRTFAAGASQDLKGKPAPDFLLKTVDDKSVKLADFKGNVVVVDFWANRCPPCRLSLPHIQKLSDDKEKAGRGLRVLAVNARERKHEIARLMEKNGYTFVVPMDLTGSAVDAYSVGEIPTTFVIGRDGLVRAVFVGFDEKEGGRGVDAAVEKALEEK